MWPLAPLANSITKVVLSSFSTSRRGAEKSAPLPYPNTPVGSGRVLTKVLLIPATELIGPTNT
jgi:hypothetical protein